jgi:16S rRNA pseudouridine516 synthase
MRYYMLNKPRGLISARTDAKDPTVMSLFPPEEREGLIHVGRLDKDTEGFMIITDDGALCYRLTSPRMLIKKRYYFIALGKLDGEKIKRLENGIAIYQREPEKITAPAEVELLGESFVKEVREYINPIDMHRSGRCGDLPVSLGIITVTEGKKHQVRRMIRGVGCYVLYLKRIAIGGVELDPELPVGSYRALTEAELSTLKGE